MPSPPRSPLIALIAVIGCGLLPAGASAEKFVVDTLADPGEPACVEFCSLRAAIAASNELGGPDEIEFAVQGQITLEANPLPAIVDELTITGPTPSGTPTVAIEGSATVDKSAFVVNAPGSADISGLSIAGFDEGAIVLNGSDDNTICGNHLGTDLAGTFPKPNWIGVTIMNGARFNEIGWGCETGNLISANEAFGIFDEGEETRIAGNRIGTDIAGSPLPNGLGGIIVGTNAWRPLIAYGPDDPPAPNTIAFNEGAGVLVEDAESYPVIVGNSIYANDGVGIEFNVGEFNAPPTLESAEVSGGQLTVKGTLGLGGGQALDFYANEDCDPSGFGEGQTPLGFDEFESGGPGTPFEAVLEAAVSSDQPVITATTTVGGELSATGPFSNCVEAEGIPDPPGPPGPPAPPPPVPEPLVLAPSPMPVNTQSVVVESISGKVLVKVPGSGKFVDVATLTSIPIGSIVDARKGKVRLTSVNAAGIEQSAVFYDGMFRITRQDRSGLVTLRLVGGDFSHCKKAGRSSATASKRRGRQLWGSGKGRFRTEGNFGAAVVRGTVWLTKDQCKGTFIRVRQGRVSVTDFVLDRTFTLPAGKGYWAKKNP